MISRAHRIHTLALALGLAIAAVPMANSAQAQVVSNKTISFARGATSATVTNVVTGYNQINYKVNARAGQAMTVQLIAQSPYVKYNIYMPGAVAGRDQTYYDGTTVNTRTFSGVLRESGIYTIQVYLDNTAAARKIAAPFRLRVTIPPATSQPSVPGPDDGGHGPDEWETYGFSGSLNVRSGPGTGYARVGTIYPGLTVRNEGCRGVGDARWCKINANLRSGATLNGWVSGRYLREASGVSTPPPATEPGTPTPGTVKYWQIWNLATSLNVRSGPGTSYSKVGTISKGSIVNNLGCSGAGTSAWCKVSSLPGTGSTVTGWVSAAYLREYTAR